MNVKYVSYKKPSLKPTVRFPNARVFNQTVVMDLKEYSKNVWFLHLATRYSAAAVIRSKDKVVIAEKLCQIWIAIFGSPHKFFSDNGGEFSNEVYRDLCENFNIAPATTAAESPWSNGTCERHNALLTEAVTKTMVDTKCDLETALALALNAKNSLQSFYGFSPNQLVFGRNHNLPSVLVDDPPALEATSCSQMIADNLNALHRAREAFIQQEASEKIRRALRHQIRSSGDLKFVCGDIVYYKRNDSSKGKDQGLSLVKRDSKFWSNMVEFMSGSIPVDCYIELLQKYAKILKENLEMCKSLKLNILSKNAKV